MIVQIKKGVPYIRQIPLYFVNTPIENFGLFNLYLCAWLLIIILQGMWIGIWLPYIVIKWIFWTSTSSFLSLIYQNKNKKLNLQFQTSSLPQSSIIPRLQLSLSLYCFLVISQFISLVLIGLSYYFVGLFLLIFALLNSTLLISGLIGYISLYSNIQFFHPFLMILPLIAQCLQGYKQSMNQIFGFYEAICLIGMALSGCILIIYFYLLIVELTKKWKKW